MIYKRDLVFPCGYEIHDFVKSLLVYPSGFEEIPTKCPLHEKDCPTKRIKRVKKYKEVEK